MIPRVLREFGAIRVSTTDWPIVLMEFPEKRLEDVHLHAALDYIEQLMRSAASAGQKCFQITDFTRMHELAPAAQRKYAAEWMQATLHLQRAASVGAANVTPSAILRGIVTAVHWVQPPPTPTIFVATRREAIAHALEKLDAAMVPVPPDVRKKAT